jgi:hypothetical protein
MLRLSVARYKDTSKYQDEDWNQLPPERDSHADPVRGHASGPHLRLALAGKEEILCQHQDGTGKPFESAAFSLQ